MRYDLIDVLNQIIHEASEKSVSDSKISQNSFINSKEGSMIITLKFFKYVTDKDINKEQREIEIIRSISFVEIEGFNHIFTEILLNNQTVSPNKDPKNFSLLSFKNLIESIATLDFEKYTEINSTLNQVLIDILKISNSTHFLFGFIDQNEASILESSVTLGIMNKFKTLNTDYFFDIVHDMKIDSSRIGNKCFNREFQTIEIMVYIIINTYY